MADDEKSVGNTGKQLKNEGSVALLIREGKEEDEDKVVELWKACHLTVPYNNPNHDFRLAIRYNAVPSPPSCSTVLVGVLKQDQSSIQADIVGSIVCGHDGHRGWLYYVAVRPNQQKLGIGKEMVKAAQDWLKQRGIAKVQLLIREGNARVIEFYERLGFEVTPRVVMAKWIE